MIPDTDTAREAFAAVELTNPLLNRPLAGAEAAAKGVLERVGLPADPDVTATLALFVVAGFLIGGGNEPGFAEAVLDEVAKSATTAAN
ncbi:hypothetical protein FF100_22365 [Methylobacterium terricola]|uniref:Uncharacterized protein n=1 Tax=Methylobacterium terricola TaxID=2583531 RepID=A0A5C4LFF7_9HYPH|nr:hypothetical protein [Methylobacterium terricola]TNC10419.1 hypothetical protein FF100_22365 [Methylobacterium terricola]